MANEKQEEEDEESVNPLEKAEVEKEKVESSKADILSSPTNVNEEVSIS